MNNRQFTLHFLQTLFLGILLIGMPVWGHAQPPASGGGRPVPKARIYGKVVEENGKGLGYAAVQCFGKQMDPVTKTMKDTLLQGQLSKDNGDFNMEGVPVMGELTVVFSFMGYSEVRQTVSFGGAPGAGPKPGAMPGGMPAGGFPGFGGGLEKDMGNIVLSIEAEVLGEVEVTGQAAVATIAIDRKTFRVDKDLSATGGTAQDALKNVPSVSVDLDGNVSLRNAAPQIFVDGRPTTLALNQIPADAIESIEVITNPSAKYDAGGGTAGILNIVLKKEKRAGYNGNVRLGTDSRGGANLNTDINVSGKKVNAFASAMYFGNRGVGTGETDRQNLFGDVKSNVTQLSEINMRGSFANARAGLDFFLDNRNTLTLSANMVRGHFTPGETLETRTDYLYTTGIQSSTYTRTSAQDRGFRNVGASLQFKHLFPKKGAEWTADFNYNKANFDGNSNYSTVYSSGTTSRERQESMGFGSFLTLQSDFVNPIDARTKLEGGLKATIRDNKNDNANLVANSNGGWNQISQLADHFKYNDQVYAGYLQANRQYNKWGVQAGLRAESSFYTGDLTAVDSSFSINYPISLFPSLFFSRKLNEMDQLQLAYTRRINRPNFFQTMPFTDFSDSLNLRRGEPGLLPEFTNGIELSYQNFFKKGSNLLVSLYYKQASNLITSYQFTEFSTVLNRDVVITSFTNSNSASAFGLEWTLRNNIGKNLNITSNLNVYQSRVDASNVENDLTISRMSAFLKETVQITLPKKYSLQLNGEYRTRASFTPSAGGDPWRGGGPSTNSAQGYTKAIWFLDASVRKDFLKNNRGSLTLSVQDIFRSRRFGSYTDAGFFTQESSRIMNPQLVRINFSFRFGETNASLFNRKNNRVNTQGNDMMSN